VKKILSFFIALSVLIAAFSLSSFAESEAQSWYCKHVKDHAQPQADAALRYVEEHGGYYIDHNHTRPDAEDKVLYLTFDAGYENGNVAKILDILRDEAVPAAFFILGGLIKTAPALVQRMAEEGHLVCNHTLRHRDMSHASDSDFLSELRALETLYQDTTGGKLAAYYRPPEGRFSRENLICAQKNGYKTIFWSFAYPDWDNGRQMTEAAARKIVLENLHNGEVMLLHPTSATNAAILGDIIREAKAQGYRFGTLDELTAGRA